MHVLIATDGSPSSIDAARGRGRILRVAEHVTLLSVLTEIPGDDAGGFEGSVYSPGEQDRLVGTGAGRGRAESSRRPRPR